MKLPSTTTSRKSTNNNHNINNNTNEADNTAYGVSAVHIQVNTISSTAGDNLTDAMICAFLASQPNSPQLAREDLEQIDLDDLEEMDLHWEMAMLTIRARRFISRTGRKLNANGQRIGFDKSKVECYNCYKNGHFARECRNPKKQDNKGRENGTRTVTVETSSENALIAQDEMGGYDWSYQAEEEQPTNFALMAYTSSGSSSGSDSEVDTCSKSCVKAYASLKEQYDILSSNYKKSQHNLLSYKAGLESIETRLVHYKKNEVVFEESINVLKLEVKLRDNALVENKKKLEQAEKERDELKLTLEKFQNSSKCLNSLLESQVHDKSKTGLGYNAVSPIDSSVISSEMLENQENTRSDKGYNVVPPPYTGKFMAPKPNLMFIDEIVHSENLNVTTEFTIIETANKDVEPKTIRENIGTPPIIEEWTSDDESEIYSIPYVQDKTVKHITEKTKFVKTVRETAENVTPPKHDKHYPKGNQRNWNNLKSQRLGSEFRMINKACYVCGSFEHLQYGCDKKVVKPVWNNSRRVNHKNFANKISNPYPNRSFVPQAVLTRTGKLNTVSTSINTAKASVNTVVRPINTVVTKSNVNHYKQTSNAFKRGNSHIKRPFNKFSLNQNSSKQVNTVRVKDNTTRDRAVLSKNKGKRLMLLRPQHAGFGKPNQVVHQQLSRNTLTLMHEADPRNKFFLSEYENYDGGLVCFGDGKGRITGIGKIHTEKLVFNNVHFCKELKYNLNSVAERKNKTLIEAARTMLFDSRLSITFWAEAVNTTCYVLNRVLITKPHNKTPYELIRGRPPLIDFMKPFGCPITILNTRDQLGKFDGKANEGYFVGLVQQAKEYEHTNNTNNFNAVSTPVSAAGPSSPVNTAELYSPFKHVFQLPNVQNVSPMDNTKIFDGTYDDEEVGPEADLNNLETTIEVSSIPITKIHRDHPLKNVIGNLHSALLTRRQSKQNLEELGIEPKKVIQALADPSWVEAMQDECWELCIPDLVPLVILDIIVNGDLQDEPAPTGDQTGPSAPPDPKTTKQLAAKSNQGRVKRILLLAIYDEYILKFHNVPDAKSL
ncbi:ribonuclease H-like domain-containing protein [Tanacetum coccineum]